MGQKQKEVLRKIKIILLDNTITETCMVEQIKAEITDYEEKYTRLDDGMSL